MLALLRRDPTVRALRRWLILAALAGWTMESIRIFFTLRAAAHAEQAQTYFLLVAGLWIPVAIFVCFGRIGERCSRFDMALPIDARRLWLTHVVAVTLSGLAVLAVAVGAVLSHDWLLALLPGDAPLPGRGPGGVALALASGLVLVLVGFQCRQPSLRRISRGRDYVVLAVASILGLLAFTLIVATSSPAWVAAPIAVAVLVAVRTHRSLPPVFDLVPLEPEREGEAPPAPAGVPSSIGGGGTWSSCWTVCRVLYRGVAPGQLVKVSTVVWLGFPFTFVWGASVGGLFYDDDAVRFLFITLSAYLLFCFLAGPLAQVHVIDPLPVSRKRLFAFVTLPLLALFAAGYGAGRVGRVALYEPGPRVEFHDGFARACPRHTRGVVTVRVPLEYCRIAWDGQSPDLASPWGESYPARDVSLFGNSRAVLYSPFGTPPGSSPEFAALQIGRAVEAVYDESIPVEEIADRYLTVDDDGAVAWKDGGEAFAERIGALPPRMAVPLFPVILAGTAVMFFFFAVLYFRAFRASVSDGKRKLAYFVILGFALVVHLTPFVLFLNGVAHDWVLAAAVKILVRRVVEGLPAGTLVVWAACLGLASLAYLWAQRRFERIEAPVPRDNEEA
jgi:hypothetical protein